MWDYSDLSKKGLKFAIGGMMGVFFGIGFNLIWTSFFHLFYLTGVILAYGLGFFVNFGFQILLGNIRIDSQKGQRPYSYRYPRNLISWFFLAQRHTYIRSILPNSKNLDIGCGLFKITSDSIGMDRKGWKRPDVTGSVFDIPFPAEHFDSVTLLEVIEHFSPEDQNRILTEIHRVLKPEGRLILSMPNISQFWGIPYRLVWWVWERTTMNEYLHEHVGMIPRRELLRILMMNRFQVLDVHHEAILDLIVNCRKISKRT